MKPVLLERLAAVCYATQLPADATPELSLQRVESISQALSKAIDLRLREDPVQIANCSAMLRELFTIELSRLSAPGRAFAVATRAMDLVRKFREYPIDEQRWLESTIADTANMFEKMGKDNEAVRWRGLLQEPSPVAKQSERENTGSASVDPRSADE